MGWQRDVYEGLRPLLFATDTEWIHRTTVTLTRKAGEGSYGRSLLNRLAHDGPAEAWTATRPVEHMGLWFRNPVGLGAGFDKDGEALAGWGGLGFGFAEVGTVTPQSQPGNPRPRVWRLPDDGAIVNRMGFNNHGAAALADHVRRARPWLPPGFVVGVSIGRGMGTSDEAAADDYRAALAAVAPVADYVAINVSSPNTAGLASLQDPDRLVALVTALSDVEPKRPLVVKLSADLAPGGPHRGRRRPGAHRRGRPDPHQHDHRADRAAQPAPPGSRVGRAVGEAPAGRDAARHRCRSRAQR